MNDVRKNIQKKLQCCLFYSYSYQKVSTSETEVSGVCDLRKFSEETLTSSEWPVEPVTDGHRFVIFQKKDGLCNISSDYHDVSPTQHLESRTLPGKSYK